MNFFLKVRSLLRFQGVSGLFQREGQGAPAGELYRTPLPSA